MKKQKLLNVFLSISMLIATISTSFADNGTLPKVLQNYKPVHDAIYSQKIDENNYTQEEITTIENFLRNAISQSDFSIVVSIDNINDIIDADKYVSSVEMFWSPEPDGLISYNEEYPSRKYVTPEFFHVNLKDLTGSDYEKYGYLSCKDKKQDFLDSDMYEYYGNIVLNFKKENLMNRTTLTIGDSLNKRHRLGINSITPTLINDPKMVCIPGYSKEYADLLLKFIKSGKLLPNRPNLITKLINPDTGNYYFEYFELQFHGDLKLTRDVESVDIIKTYVEDESERARQESLRQEAYQKIKNLGIPCNIIDCTNVQPPANNMANDFLTPELKSSFQTENGTIMLTAPEGIFKSGSQLCAKFLDPASQEYREAFKNLDNHLKDLTERLKVYDIFILDPYGNKVTQFDDYVKLYIQIPENYDESDLEAIHISESSDQEFDEWVETIDGKKYLAFKTNHFSPYAIIDKNTTEINFLIYIFTPILLISIILFILYLVHNKKKYINLN